ncbi:MAG: SIMPL domain-containing protein [Candidatus Marsarchaeota archaeon]|nr:SIMPL domain-containing protein [Candidatus Marsarchaeota archaeon]MCL5112776.1 SIMPL domain-containing protein [Candidatus Marsarchaeota archaeon]
MTSNATRLPFTLLSVVLALVIVLLVMGAVYGAYIFAHKAASERGQGSIMVAATGIASAIPDESVVSIMVNATGTTAQQAVRNLSESLMQLNSTLYGYVGNNRSLISTTSYSVSKTYNAPTFTAAEGITATIPNASRTSMLLGNVSAIHGVFVLGVSAMLSDSQASSLRGEALMAAVQNATQQASAVAAPNNVTIKNITIESYYVYPYPFAEGAYGGSALISTQNVSPEYYMGMSKVVEHISATFSYG